jgi:hypothetical protein
MTREQRKWFLSGVTWARRRMTNDLRRMKAKFDDDVEELHDELADLRAEIDDMASDTGTIVPVSELRLH